MCIVDIIRKGMKHICVKLIVLILDGGMMSDCDNCIHTHYIDNEWYCLLGNRPKRECEDYHHWNGLTEEERDQCRD